MRVRIPSTALMKVKVTQEDIDRGERFDIKKCPVALALKRKTWFGSISVGISRASIFPPPFLGKIRSYRIPPEAQENIRFFDMTGEMKPFEFELVEIPR